MFSPCRCVSPAGRSQELSHTWFSTLKLVTVDKESTKLAEAGEVHIVLIETATQAPASLNSETQPIQSASKALHLGTEMS